MGSGARRQPSAANKVIPLDPCARGCYKVMENGAWVCVRCGK